MSDFPGDSYTSLYKFHQIFSKMLFYFPSICMQLEENFISDNVASVSYITPACLALLHFVQDQYIEDMYACS